VSRYSACTHVRLKAHRRACDEARSHWQAYLCLPDSKLGNGQRAVPRPLLWISLQLVEVARKIDPVGMPAEQLFSEGPFLLHIVEAIVRLAQGMVQGALVAECLYGPVSSSSTITRKPRRQSGG
jgi:hypothetical protein